MVEQEPPGNGMAVWESGSHGRVLGGVNEWTGCWEGTRGVWEEWGSGWVGVRGSVSASIGMALR